MNPSFSLTRFNQQCRFLALFKCLRKGFFFIVFFRTLYLHQVDINVIFDDKISITS